MAAGAAAAKTDVAARGETAQVPTATGSSGAWPSAATTAAADDDCDMDGFQQVRRKGGRKVDAAARGAADAAGGGARTAQTARRDDDADEEVDADVEEEPTPSQLQQAWREELALVKSLRQQGLPAEHPAMQAACQARDEAERVWRSAKDPTPASVRLSRAQSKLDRAIALQADVRREITECERKHQEQMDSLRSKMEECAERVRNRRCQLEQVQEEVAEEGSGGRARAERSDAVRQVHGTLCNHVGPAIAALAEQVDTGSPAWTMLNELLGALTSSKALLEKAIPAAPTAQEFNIAEEEGDGAKGEGEEGADDQWDGSNWSESHDLAERAANGEADANTWGAAAWTQHRWEAAAQGPSHQDPMDHDMGSGQWWESTGTDWQTGGVRWQATGHGKWTRTDWAEAWEEEEAGRGADSEQPAPARRRLEPSAAPHTQSSAAEAEAKRTKAHQERVSQIVLQAIDAGIQPLTDEGEELHMLAPQQLDAWLAEHFPAAVQA